MTLEGEKVDGGLDFIDLLLRNTVETSGYHGSQPWTITIHDTQSPERNATDDFLDSLLGGSDSSSVPASPLWSPCTTDSGINEEPLTDPTGSPHPPCGGPPPAFDAPAPPQGSQGRPAQLLTDQRKECRDQPGQFGIAYYLKGNKCSSLLSCQTLTVKDLLLSNPGQNTRQLPQHPLPELLLNEDERTLLAKEGVDLPSKLPLSKFEEKVLKKIRRKIRNKRSAQESRKKRREYVDSLEGRMSVCTSHNLELQRKIHQLEETNNALLEQLNHMQALLSSSSGKTTHKGTCILVLLLSFSLLISSNLQPDPYSQLSQADFIETRVPSRSLQSVDEDAPPPPPPLPSPLPRLLLSRGIEAWSLLTQKLRAWVDFTVAEVQASQRQDYRHRNHL